MKTKSLSRKDWCERLLRLLKGVQPPGLFFKDIVGQMEGIDRRLLRDLLEDLQKERVLKVYKKHYSLYVGPKKEEGLEGIVEWGKTGAFIIHKEDSYKLWPENANLAIAGDLVRFDLREDRGRKQVRVLEIIRRQGFEILVQSQNGRLISKSDLPLPITTKTFDFPPRKWIRCKILPVIDSQIHIEPLGEVEKGLDPDLFELVAQARVPQQFSRQYKFSDFAATRPSQIDHRDQSCYTIDGSDARDFDDSIFVEQSGHDFILYVHIADVAHFVKEDSAIDKEAVERGTSIYFPRHVIPMLPEVLSNELCSLKPHEDRLTLTCKIKINPAGEVLSSSVYTSIIHSKRRFTYEEVQKILDQEDQDPFHSQLKLVFHLHKILLRKRQEGGAIDFDFPETKLQLDQDFLISGLETSVRLDAHRMIEECMLIANTCVAQILIQKNIAAPFRHHPAPKPDSLQSLTQMLKGMGLKPGLLRPKPVDMQNLVASLPENLKDIILPFVLRSMQQALYRVDKSDHFGLAKDYYCHFTSPIRRYPDLLVHRSLHSRLATEILHLELPFLPVTPLSDAKIKALAAKSSMQERRAVDLERDYEARKKCRYASKLVGAKTEASVAGMIKQGLYLRLHKWPLEGFLPFESMNGVWEFDETLLHAYRRSPALTLKMGHVMTVTIAETEIKKSRILLKVLKL